MKGFRTKMYAVMRDGALQMILPDIDTAETYYGLLSKNGTSKFRWEIKPVEVKFQHETAAERRKRLDRSVKAVGEINQRLSGRT